MKWMSRFDPSVSTSFVQKRIASHRTCYRFLINGTEKFAKVVIALLD